MASAGRPRIIVDTGPLVAFLNQSESSHRGVVEAMASLPTPFLTCEPVLAETFFLLSRLNSGPERFFDLLESGLLITNFSVFDERPSLAKLVRKYQDLPMSLADACLVRMAELAPEASVFTLDAHFRTYRKNGRQLIPVLIPAH